MIDAALPVEAVTHTRAVEEVYAGVANTDGAGVRFTRLLGQWQQARLDPFLLLDAFASDGPQDCLAGCPDHPHRGFETVTYMLAGRMHYCDSAGHEGVLQRGGVQWMTAGRGVVHSEIPLQEEGVMEGFQLWLNLPACDKMRDSWYRDFAAAELPHFVTPDGVAVTVIAGCSHGVTGAVSRAATAPLYLDVQLPAGTRFAQTLEPAHNAFVYVHRGEVAIGGRTVPPGHLAILADDAAADGVVIEARRAARLLLIAGCPLRERIVQYGPFVMNTEQEIYQALNDLRDGTLAGA